MLPPIVPLGVGHPVADSAPPTDPCVDLILTGLGAYSSLGTSICNVTPFVNLVKVEYTDNTKLFNSSFPNFVNASQPWAGQDAPFLGNFGTQMFLRALRVGQSPLSNAMGDDVIAFFDSIPNGSQNLEDILVRRLFHVCHYLQRFDHLFRKITFVESLSFR